MNILVLAENINLNRTSSGIRSFNFLNLLSLKYDVTCIYLEKYDEDSRIVLKNVELNELQQNAKLNWFVEGLDKVPKFSGFITHFTGLNLFNYRLIKSWKNQVKQTLSEKEFDLIFVLGTGHDFIAHHAVARLDINIPIVAHIHDPYPFNQYPEPYKKDKAIYKPLAKQFKKVISKVDYVSFPSLYLKDWMSRFYPEISNKYLILPHPESLVKAKELNIELPKELNLNTKFSLVHLGSLLDNRNPLSLLRAYKRFCDNSQEKRENSCMYIIGKMDRSHSELITNEWNGFENIKAIDARISYLQSKEIMNKASVLILIEAIGEFSPFMPGKLSDYIVAEKPILALTPKKSEVSRLLGAGYKFSTQVNEEDEIYTIINMLWDNWKRNSDVRIEYPDLQKYISVEETLKSFDKVLN